MLRKFSLLLLILLMTVIGCSKFSYRTPHEKFDHDRHLSTLTKEEKGCFFCHKLPDVETLIEHADEANIAPELKVEGKCHTCHKDDTTKIDSAPNTCVTCHENMDLVKPADHIKEWRSMHGIPASLNSRECESCHSDWYCENCHSRQYSSAENIKHSRTFKLKHSFEAMIDPASCDSCHRSSFCADCHLRESK